MSKQPSVSIALPVKNGLPHLRDAIEGLHRQTYRNFELFVQDSVSTDGSVEYLQSIKGFPVHIVSEPDESLVNGYNRALRRCTGDLVVAAASDEILDDDALEKYVAWHHEHPGAVYIFSGSRLVDGPWGGTRVYMPGPFNLIDYLRHDMCTTTAGVFNRRLLGKEFYLDESLKTVPDFELMTRMALRFGQERLVRKEAVTMTARADAASSSFRPEGFAQFARDKTTIIDRLLGWAGNESSGASGIHQELLHFVRREILANMHATFAGQLFDLVGDAPVFREHVLAAHRYMPGAPIIEELVSKGRHLDWDPGAWQLTERRNVPPIVPPKGLASVVGSIGAEKMAITPHWASGGARKARRWGRTVFTTPPGSWHYAAMAPLDLPGLSLDREWHWVKVTVSHVAGKPLLSLFNPDRNAIVGEIRLTETSDTRDYHFEYRNNGCNSLLLRNGHEPRASSVAIRAIEILAMQVRPEYAEP
ncbi:MAG: glycosyltransferase [Hyphomicrobiales bacterium]|nr:glycosyltransferase [Hyphomicrobiales bacterium]